LGSAFQILLWWSHILGTLFIISCSLVVFGRWLPFTVAILLLIFFIYCVILLGTTAATTECLPNTAPAVLGLFALNLAGTAATEDWDQAAEEITATSCFITIFGPLETAEARGVIILIIWQLSFACLGGVQFGNHGCFVTELLVGMYHPLYSPSSNDHEASNFWQQVAN
jgi:uncharacterized membrane protein YeiB